MVRRLAAEDGRQQDDGRQQEEDDEEHPRQRHRDNHPGTPAGPTTANVGPDHDKGRAQPERVAVSCRPLPRVASAHRMISFVTRCRTLVRARSSRPTPSPRQPLLRILGGRPGAQPDREDRVREPLPLEDTQLLAPGGERRAFPGWYANVSVLPSFRSGTSASIRSNAALWEARSFMETPSTPRNIRRSTTG